MLFYADWLPHIEIKSLSPTKTHFETYFRLFEIPKKKAAYIITLRLISSVVYNDPINNDLTIFSSSSSLQICVRC